MNINEEEPVTKEIAEEKGIDGMEDGEFLCLQVSVLKKRILNEGKKSIRRDTDNMDC